MNARSIAIVVLAFGLLAAPPAADAQQPAKIPRIGFLRAEVAPESYIEGFRQGLRELGYVEGQNILIEYRWTEGNEERLRSLVAELIRLKVDLIVTSAPAATRAAKEATAKVPIVMVHVADPVAFGFVASLAHPGGNVTGFAFLFLELSGKRLEVLKEALPKLSRVAVLGNPAHPAHTLWVREATVAAESLGVRLQFLETRGPDEFEGAFRTMARARADGLLVLPDTMLYGERARLADFVAKSRLPTMFAFREHVAAGGLMAYEASVPDLIRRAATYVDKILKGAKPADLPVEQPTKFELVINLKTAKALGLTIPQSMLIRADLVIQ